MGKQTETINCRLTDCAMMCSWPKIQCFPLCWGPEPSSKTRWLFGPAANLLVCGFVAEVNNHCGWFLMVFQGWWDSVCVTWPGSLSECFFFHNVAFGAVNWNSKVARNWSSVEHHHAIHFYFANCELFGKYVFAKYYITCNIFKPGAYIKIFLDINDSYLPKVLEVVL